MNMTVAAIAVVFVSAMSYAHAAPGLYVGIGAGVTNFEDEVEVRDIGNVDLDDDDTTYRLFGGYRATDNFAIEGGYRDFGEATSGPFTAETDGWDVSAVGLLLLGPVDVFAKGGVIFWDTKGSGGVPNNDGEDLTWGVGGALNIGSLWFRLESEWFDVDFPDNVQTVTASVGWTF